MGALAAREVQVPIARQTRRRSVGTYTNNSCNAIVWVGLSSSLANMPVCIRVKGSEVRLQSNLYQVIPCLVKPIAAILMIRLG